MQTPSPAQLKEAIDRSVPEALGWLRRMVEINSFTTNLAGIEALTGLTEQCFATFGFAVERCPARHPEHGAHLFLRSGADDAIPPIVLVTHLDTVFPPEEEERHDFHWREAPGESRVYGPGTVDIKGGTVLIWLILKALRECAPEWFAAQSWFIAANSAEEVIGSDFAGRVMERCGGRARAVLVFEGGPRDDSGWHLVTARKGRVEYEIHATGRGAHAGSAFSTGINAVVALGALLPRIAALSDAARDLTVNIATIEGGTVLNRVPHAARASLEARAYDPAALDDLHRALEKMAGTADNGATISIHHLGTTRPWPAREIDAGLREVWRSAAVEIGMPVAPQPRGGLSDANYLCQLGPTLDGLGPAGGNAHCSENDAASGKAPEYVDPASFAPKALLNAVALLRLLGGP